MKKSVKKVLTAVVGIAVASVLLYSAYYIYAVVTDEDSWKRVPDDSGLLSGVTYKIDSIKAGDKIFETNDSSSDETQAWDDGTGKLYCIYLTFYNNTDVPVNSFRLDVTGNDAIEVSPYTIFDAYYTMSPHSDSSGGIMVKLKNCYDDNTAEKILKQAEFSVYVESKVKHHFVCRDIEINLDDIQMEF